MHLLAQMLTSTATRNVAAVACDYDGNGRPSILVLTSSLPLFNKILCFAQHTYAVRSPNFTTNNFWFLTNNRPQLGTQPAMLTPPMPFEADVTNVLSIARSVVRDLSRCP